MILLDYPFVSDYLIQTIRKNNYKVVATREARDLLPEANIGWVSEKEAGKLINAHPETPLYTNSENALNWLERHAGDSELVKHAQLFKDKARFRELIRERYPGFSFKTIKLEDIPSLEADKLTFPFVIKPAVGFFSIGVHVVNNKADLDQVKDALTIEQLASMYPRNVLDTSTFIMEEYIAGEEFAIDCYFNDAGEAVILNILHHKFSSGVDTSDRVYSTSRDIVRSYLHSFERFLQDTGKEAGLKNFPAHVELRIDASGKIHPIEINPIRFGGWCTTADLLGISTACNPYELYFQKSLPDWDQVFKGRENKTYSIVILNNNSGFKAEEIAGFDYELLLRDFEHPLEIRKMDVKKYAVFGFLFLETNPGKESELERILVSDLRKYIRPA
jgi:hypothetical protein